MTKTFLDACRSSSWRGWRHNPGASSRVFCHWMYHFAPLDLREDWRQRTESATWLDPVFPPIGDVHDFLATRWRVCNWSPEILTPLEKCTNKQGKNKHLNTLNCHYLAIYHSVICKMGQCCAFDCTKLGKHGFPKDPALLKAWRIAIRPLSFCF